MNQNKLIIKKEKKMSKSGIRATYDHKNGVCKINIGGKRGILDMSYPAGCDKDLAERIAFSKQHPECCH